jgi:hypothetical protein
VLQDAGTVQALAQNFSTSCVRFASVSNALPITSRIADLATNLAAFLLGKESALIPPFSNVKLSRLHYLRISVLTIMYSNLKVML